MTDGNAMPPSIGSSLAGSSFSPHFLEASKKGACEDSITQAPKKVTVS